MNTQLIPTDTSEASGKFECICCGADKWKQHRYTNAIFYLECLSCHYFAQTKDGVHEKANQFELEQQKFYDESSLFLSSSYSLLGAELLSRRVATIRKFLQPAASIIEVGPGAGEFIVALGNLGYSATAVEHSKVLAGRLAEKKNLSVMVGDFAEQKLPESSYDAYCSFHVIEHVVDFRKHLRIARDCVKQGGYAFIATPNSRGWEHRMPFTLSPNYDSSHFQLFSPEALTLVLLETGWEVISITTPSYSIAWLRIVTKILRRIRRQDEGNTGGHYASFANGVVPRIGISIFSKVTLPFRYFQEVVDGGNELLIVAKRSG